MIFAEKSIDITVETNLSETSFFPKTTQMLILVKKRVEIKKGNSSFYLSTNVIAFVGQVLTHKPQPKHKSGLNESDPLIISLAPN
jgi:hypothetical protein